MNRKRYADIRLQRIEEKLEAAADVLEMFVGSIEREQAYAQGRLLLELFDRQGFVLMRKPKSRVIDNTPKT